MCCKLLLLAKDHKFDFDKKARVAIKCLLQENDDQGLGYAVYIAEMGDKIALTLVSLQ